MVQTRKREKLEEGGEGTSGAASSAKRKKAGPKQPSSILAARQGGWGGNQYHVLFDDGSKSWKKEEDVPENLLDEYEKRAEEEWKQKLASDDSKVWDPIPAFPKPSKEIPYDLEQDPINDPDNDWVASDGSTALFLRTCEESLIKTGRLTDDQVKKLKERKLQVSATTSTHRPEWKSPLSIALRSPSADRLQYLMDNSTSLLTEVEKKERRLEHFVISGIGHSEMTTGKKLSHICFKYLYGKIPDSVTFATYIEQVMQHPVSLEDSRQTLIFCFNKLIQKDQEDNKVPFDSRLHMSALTADSPDGLNLNSKMEVDKKDAENDGDVVDPEWPVLRLTPLHLAMFNPNAQIAKALIAQGADSRLMDWKNLCPLHYAAASDHAEAIKLLLLDAKNPCWQVMLLCDRSPLDMAIAAGSVQAAKYLIEYVLNHTTNAAKEFNWNASVFHAVHTNQPKMLWLLSQVGPINEIGKAQMDSCLDEISCYGWVNMAKLFDQCCSEAFRKKQEKIRAESEPSVNEFGLRCALEHGHLGMMKYWHAERKLELNRDDEGEDTLLWNAIGNGYTHCAEWLIQNGADVNEIHDSGITLISRAVRFGFPECVELLLKKNPALVNVENDDVQNGFKPLMYLIASEPALNDYHLRVFHILMQHKATVDDVDAQGNTLLHFAVRAHESAQSTDVLKVLLEATKDKKILNNVNKLGYTALLESAAKPTFALLLLQQGDVLDVSCQIPVQPTKKVKKDEEIPRPSITTNEANSFIHQLVASPHAGKFKEILQLLLTRKTFDINAKNNAGMTPLHIATHKGTMHVVEALCEANGIDVNAKNIYQHSPIHLAVEGNHMEIFEILISKGGKLSSDENGSTELHKCITSVENAPWVRALCKSGVDVNAVDKDGNTAIHLLSADNVMILFMLNDYKAKLDTCNKIGATPLYNSLTKRLTNVSFYLMSHMGASLTSPPPKDRDSLFKAAMQMQVKGLVQYILDCGVQMDGAIQDAISTQNQYVCQILFQRIYKEQDKQPLKKPTLHDVFSAVAVQEDNNAGRNMRRGQAKKQTNRTVPAGFLDLLYKFNQFIDINSLDKKGFTALHYTVLNRFDTALWYLLTKFNADPSIAATENGMTPLHLAVKQNDTESVNTLLNNTPPSLKEKLLAAQDSQGRSCLHIAVSTWDFGTFANSEMVKILVNAGVSVAIRDKQGRSAATVAGALSSRIGDRMLYLMLNGQKDQKVSEQIKKDFEAGRSESSVKLNPKQEQLALEEAKKQSAETMRFRKAVDSQSQKKKEEKVEKRKKEGKSVEYTIPLDEAVTHLKNTQVYIDEEGAIYDVMLNQTDITFGTFGHNKFYVIQLLIQTPPPLRKHPKREPKHSFYTINRWGRVGGSSERKFQQFGDDKEAALKDFKSKFQAKSSNSWDDAKKSKFTKKKDKYDMILRQYDEKDEEDRKKELLRIQAENDDKVENAKSELGKEVLQLIQKIANPKTLQMALANMGVDTSQMPLGRITKEQIALGYSILSQLEDSINKLEEIKSPKQDGPKERENVAEIPDDPKALSLVKRQKNKWVAVDPAEKKKLKDEINELTNRFYTVIPRDFGRRLPPTIENVEQVKENTQILDALQEVKTAVALLAEVGVDGVEGIHNKWDVYYKLLGCNIEFVPMDTEEFKVIDQYLQNGQDQNSYYRSTIKNVFKLNRADEVANQYQMKAHHHQVNKDGQPKVMLLWHGTGLPNYTGILSQGLRIAPPEAPRAGYMFGKGIYFADVFSKSYGYTRDSKLMLLCEVLVGETFRCHESNYMLKPPEGFNSTKGLGQSVPHPDQMFYTKEGMGVPLGEPTRAEGGGYLAYNEYIVYDTKQAAMRYLVELE